MTLFGSFFQSSDAVRVALYDMLRMSSLSQQNNENNEVEMDYPELNALIAWMHSPHENSGAWSPVDWWAQDMPEEMAEIIAELCAPELRDELKSLRDELPGVLEQKQQLEERWGALPDNELRRQLKVDQIILEHLEGSIGSEESPIGTFESLGQLLDFLITLELEA